MCSTEFKVLLNQNSINTISEFTNMKNSFTNFEKQGYFSRYIGFNDIEGYLDSINKMDSKFDISNNPLCSGYLRINGLNNNLNNENIISFSNTYNNLKDINISAKNNLFSIQFPFEFKNELWNKKYKKTFLYIIDIFKRSKQSNTDSITKNFTIKLLHWTYIYFPKLFLKTNVLSNFPKFVFYGDIKIQEYLFLYFLSLIGCDVLYLNPKNDIDLEPNILNYSSLHKCSNLKEISIPNTFIKSSSEEKNNNNQVDNSRSTLNTSNSTKKVNNPNTPLDYEDLAKLSTSVVMIKVFNDKKECFASGSGVFINNKGYILTNFHVVSGGHFFEVQLEDSEKVYLTSELVKYNQDQDLALLRIDLDTVPIPLYTCNKSLVRGQKIVAIGSPLGLFNSVSDGIISGFRKFEYVEMVQFTAPISSGSSGGALLDLYGNLVGIITAGYDKGQNLNLAVPYNIISFFIQNFLNIQN